MARYIIARQMSGRKTVTSEGEEVGTLRDVIVDEVSGKIEYLLVEPTNPDLEAKLEKNEEGYYLLPYESVLAVGDYIIVDRKQI
jgi:sporulation protein YlmC with PRC-barrel domain